MGRPGPLSHPNRTPRGVGTETDTRVSLWVRPAEAVARGALIDPGSRKLGPADPSTPVRLVPSVHRFRVPFPNRDLPLYTLQSTIGVLRVHRLPGSHLWSGFFYLFLGRRSPWGPCPFLSDFRPRSPKRPPYPLHTPPLPDHTPSPRPRPRNLEPPTTGPTHRSFTPSVAQLPVPRR